MKNKVLKLLVITAVVLFTSSCDDFLNVTPHDSLSSDNAVESVEDFDNVVKSIYQQMRVASYGDIMMILPDVMSDNLLICSDGRQTWNEWHNFQFSSTTYGTAGFWLASYSGILSANEVIIRLEGDSPLKGDKDANSILAEALALRAYLHFNLVRYYGKAYVLASDTDLGVPYKVDTDAGEKPARETVRDVYSKILSDLNRAKSILSENASYNAKLNERVNLKTVNAILAKVYFNMTDYNNAATAATAAISGDGSDVVKLADYTKLWTTSMNVPEVLFRIAVLQTDSEIPGNVYGQGDVNNHKPEYVVSYSFLNEFDPNTDIRASGIQEVSLSGKNYNAIWKFHGRTGESTGKVDIPLIRTSEMYLTLAESLLRKAPADFAGARKNIEFLLKNRYAEGSVPNPLDAQLLEIVQKERRLELAFEGDRFFELKRLNMDIDRDEYGDLVDGSGVKATVSKISKSSPYYLMPIPQDEMNANNNMVQNVY